MNYAFTKKQASEFEQINNLNFYYLDMLGDASSNVHMQYLREGVLMTETEENKLNQTSFIKVKQIH